ncbi:hypothetical protein V490_08852 [Pseudogymnoascus sp. VKM F-3557]|nr:hypothetical protein V490_08852 [Pseudogymnoascus sp. VKM F-3557]
MQDQKKNEASAGQNERQQEQRSRGDASRRQEFNCCQSRIQEDYLQGQGCGRAIKAVNLRKHLQGRHRIGTSVARQASQVAPPQVGIAVKDAFRCTHCRHYTSIFPEDVDVHWEYYEHGVAEGSKTEKVRIQAWYGNFSDGYYHRYWVVAGGMPSEWEEAAPAEEAPVEEAGQVEKAPAAELNKKEIPDYISEESEVWSEEDGQEEREREGCKEKEKFDEWEGLCFGWERGEPENGGRDKMAGDWVVMH